MKHGVNHPAAREPQHPSDLEGAKVRSVELVDDYIVIRFDNDYTLYADDPTVYGPRAVSPRGEVWHPTEGWVEG